MLNRKVATLFAAILIAVGFTAATPAGPAFAGRSACPQGAVCGWNDSNWQGTQITFWPSDIYQATPAHCLNFDRTASQDKISSLASYNGAPGFEVIFYKDINCYDAPGVDDQYFLFGTSQVQNLAGTGFNDTFSSIEVPNCC